MSPIRHSLPDSRTVPKFGSLKNGNCSSVISGSDNITLFRGSICNDTSVLNDGIIPALSNTSDESSEWASQLLTMMQGNADQIVLSFEVENQVYDCVELAIFNCPKRGMNAMRINIYSDTSFRPKRDSDTLGTNIANYSLTNRSCEYLLKFCMSIIPKINSSYFNIVFPVLDFENHVFVGEVAFLRTGVDNCSQQWPPQLVEETTYLHNLKCKKCMKYSYM